jgi:hypothetical protein
VRAGELPHALIREQAAHHQQYSRIVDNVRLGWS